MHLRGLRAFASELVKIALVDADVRMLRADRNGEPYLPGGKIPTNTAEETNFVPKIAARKLAPPMIMDKLQNPTKKDEGAYQHVRDTALSGLGGALTGSGVVKLREAVKGPAYKASGKHHAIAAGVGTVAALADRAFRHREDLFGSKEKVAFMGSSTFTPARSGQAANNTAHFQDSHIHTTAKPKVSGLVGKVFRPQSEGAPNGRP